jgi:hypothetical protein
VHPFWIIPTIVVVGLTTPAFAQQKSLKDELPGSFWKLESVAVRLMMNAPWRSKKSTVTSVNAPADRC